MMSIVGQNMATLRSFMMLASFTYLHKAVRRTRLYSILNNTMNMPSSSIENAITESPSIHGRRSVYEILSQFPELDMSSSSESTMTSRLLRDNQSLDKWAHRPANLILAWLVISIPLVIWVCGWLPLLVHWLLTRDVGYRICVATATKYAWRFTAQTDLDSLRNIYADGLDIWLESHQPE